MNTKKIILTTLGGAAALAAVAYGACMARKFLKTQKEKVKETPTQTTEQPAEAPAATQAPAESAPDADESSEPLLTGLYAQYQNAMSQSEKEAAVLRIIRVLERIQVVQFDNIEQVVRDMVADEQKTSTYIAEGIVQTNDILIREIQLRVDTLRRQFEEHQQNVIRSESRSLRGGQLVFTRVYTREKFDAFVATFEDYKVRFAALKERLLENPSQEAFRDFEVKHDEFIDFLGIAERLKNPNVPFDIACEQTLNPDYKEEIENRPMYRKPRQPYRPTEK